MGRAKNDAVALDPTWDTDLEPAPGDLRIVQALLNTAPAAGVGDRLRTPQVLAQWLRAWKLLPRGAEIDAADLERIRQVRDGLWNLAWGNSGGKVRPEALDRLNVALSSAAVYGQVSSSGKLRLEPLAEGVDAAVGALVAVVGAMETLDWQRLKVCAEPECRRVYYDFAASRRRRWCGKRCRNRHHTRVWRGRRK